MRCEGKCNRGDIFCFNGKTQSGRKVMICAHCILSLKLDPVNLDYIPDHLLPTPAHFPTQAPPNFDLDTDSTTQSSLKTPLTIASEPVDRISFPRTHSNTVPYSANHLPFPISSPGHVTMHYVFFGIPSPETIQKCVTLIRFQADPARNPSDSRPVGVLWTLHDQTQKMAQEYLRTLHAELQSCHLIIMSSFSFIRHLLKRETWEAAQKNPDLGPTETIRQIFLSATKILASYLAVLVFSGTTPTVREFVTAKELFACWILFLCGGVCLDNGCQLRYPGRPWGTSYAGTPIDSYNLYSVGHRSTIERSNDYYNLFKVNNAPSHMSPFSLYKEEIVDICASVLQKKFASSPFDESQIINFNVNTDNYVLVSIERFTPAALYALRAFLSDLNLVYKKLGEVGNRDRLYGDGYGIFSACSSLIALTSLIHGILEQKYLQNPRLFTNSEPKPDKVLHMDELYNNIIPIEIDPSKENEEHLMGLTKVISPISTDSSGIIVGGWRKLLSASETYEVIERFSIVI